jgi:hypothetical protein
MVNIVSELGRLSSAAVRNIANNLFSGFYERGLNATQALKELQSQGLGYRRTDFLADYRTGKGQFDNETRIRYVGPGNLPSERILEPKYFGTPDKYSLVFRYTGEDTTTGEQTTGYFFYHRNTLDKRANMEADAASYLSEKSDKYGVDVSNVRVVEGI